MLGGTRETTEFQHGPAERSPRNGWLEFSCLGLAILLGLCRACAGRNGMMDIDGVSYIDIGQAYLRGDWNSAINPVWSPLYSWLLGAALRALRPSMYWEIPVVQLVNFFIYLTTLFCYRYLLGNLVEYHRSRSHEYQRLGLFSIPQSAWIALGYTAFMVGSLEMIEVTNVRPDMCVGAFFFLASSIVLRIHTATPNWKTYFVLGVCLGFGYLAKAALLPLSFMFILASFVMQRGIRKGLFHMSVALMGLALIAGPYITLLSTRQGHFTFSETAKLNYVWYVNDVRVVNFMTDNAPGFGHPTHPLREIFENPVAFEFASPVPGTYPLHYNAAYWWAGVEPHFNVRQQIRRLATGIHELFRLFFSKFQAGLLTGILALYLFSPKRRLAIRSAAGQWFILLPPIAGLMMYGLVYVLPRYVGSFFVVFWMGMISGWCLPDLPYTRKVLGSISVSVVLVTLLTILGSTWQFVRTSIHMGPVEWRVADYLRRIGIQPGDRIGRLALDYNLGWAVLDGVRVTSEVELDPDRADDYFTASDKVKTEVLASMFRTGVKAIVADHRERTGCETGWQAVEGTNYSVCAASTASRKAESPPGKPSTTPRARLDL